MNGLICKIIKQTIQKMKDMQKGIDPVSFKSISYF